MEVNKPVEKFRAGDVVASVWKNARVFNGVEREVLSVSFERRYKDKESGEWKSSTSFRAKELPLVRFVVEEACRYVFEAQQKQNNVGAEESAASLGGAGR